MANGSGALLVVERGVAAPSTIPLDKSVCVLGKAAEADVPLDNPFVSRMHARILRDGARFQLRDLGSKNGTYVNGERLSSDGRWLKGGDRIDLALDQVVLMFQERSGTVTLNAVPAVSSNELRVDSRSREVWVRGEKFDPPLSRKEFDVLNLLYERHSEACSRDEIAARGWSERPGGDVGDQEIDQCIRRLRLRIERDPSRPSYVTTVRGYGYKLVSGQPFD